MILHSTKFLSVPPDRQMMLAASNFEFKNRFWIIGAIFFVAFAAYNIDRQTAGVALTDWLARLRGSATTDTDYRMTFAVASLFAVLAAAIRTWGTAYLNPEVMVAGRVQTSRLVADGPYRYVRNPLYFGNILLAIGFGMMASRIGCAILITRNVGVCLQADLAGRSRYRRYPGRRLSGLLCSGTAIVTGSAPQVAFGWWCAQLDRWFPWRSIHVGAGGGTSGICRHLEAVDLLRGVGQLVRRVCNLLRDHQAAQTG